MFTVKLIYIFFDLFIYVGGWVLGALINAESKGQKFSNLMTNDGIVDEISQRQKFGIFIFLMELFTKDKNVWIKIIDETIKLLCKMKV